MMPSPHIAIFLPALHGGGAERTMLNLAAGLSARGYDVDLVLARKTGPLLREVPQSLTLVDLSASGTVSAIPRLAAYLRRRRPPVLLCALARANIAGILARKLSGVRCHLAISERNTLSRWGGPEASLHARLTVPLAVRCYPHADAVLCVSNSVADDLAQIAPALIPRLKVMYNPVVTPQLRQKAAQPCDHPWLQPDAPPVILGVGSLTVQKDFATLIRGFAVARQQRPMRLIILGEGPQRAELEQLCRELSIEQSVDLAGWADNPYPYMRRAAVFGLTSRWEGLPGVLIEALYCGPRLIATDCPGGSREVLQRGRWGRLVPIGDVHAVAAAIAAALEAGPARRPARAWLRFESDEVIDSYERLLLKNTRSISTKETATCEI